MSVPDIDAERESYLEDLITANEEVLKEVHARNYMGIDDDMVDSFESWLTRLDIEEVEDILEEELNREAKRLSQRND